MIRRLWRHGPRFLRFGLVGATGLLVNSAVMALFTSGFGLHYLWSAGVATQASTAWNFLFSEWWVFQDRTDPRHGMVRFGMFWLMNNLALPVRAVIIWMLTDLAGMHYLVSNLISLIVIMLGRYSLSDSFIWRSSTQADSPAMGIAEA